MNAKYVILRNSHGDETTFQASKVFCDCLECECTNCLSCFEKSCKCCRHKFSDSISGRDRTQEHPRVREPKGKTTNPFM